MKDVDQDPLSKAVIGAAIEVHRALGPGLLESMYEECLCREFALRGIPFVRQYEVPIEYKGVKLSSNFRIDLVVAGRLIVELKAVDSIEPIHKAQLRTYLKISGLPVGLVLNFNAEVMREGVKRVVNTEPKTL